MPTKENPWKQYVTRTLLVGGIGCGIPYIDSLQEKLAATRESNIRLEVKVETLSDDVKSMKATIELIRTRLEARGIVNRTDGVVGDVAGQDFKRTK